MIVENRSLRVPGGPAVAVAVGALLMVSSCGSTSDSASGTEPGVTATSTSVEPDASSGERDPSGDAVATSDAEEGLRYDLGQIVEVEASDGATVLVFDRFELTDGTSGPDLQTEPSIAGASDLSFLNENDLLRRYPVAPDAEIDVVEPSWLTATCDGQNAGPAVYVDGELTDLSATSPIVTLTFDDTGQVVTVREQTGC